MTGRTHDLASFTALTFIIANYPLPQLSVATALVALGANMIGGLLPDIDNTTADIWEKIRGGDILKRIIRPLVGSHRMLSHSLLGLGLTGFLSKYILLWLGTFVIADMEIVWWSLIIGYISHLISDSLTTDGIALLLPFPFRFGLPPLKSLRIKTGGVMEKAVIFPGLIFFNGYLIYSKYPMFINFFKSLAK